MEIIDSDLYLPLASQCVSLQVHRRPQLSGCIQLNRGYFWRTISTGAIIAVLLVTAVLSLKTPVNGLVGIGNWVILPALIVAPPLTPFLARKLGVAE